MTVGRISLKVVKPWEHWLYVFKDCSVVRYGPSGSPSESWWIVEWHEGPEWTNPTGSTAS